MPYHMTIEDTIQQDHLSICQEVNKQLRTEVTRLEMECASLWHKMKVSDAERGDLRAEIAVAQKLADDRLEQMQADRKQYLDARAENATLKANCYKCS